MIYPKLLTGIYMLVFFTSLSLMEFQVRYLVLFLLSSVIDSFKWLWMGSLHVNIHLMQEFFKFFHSCATLFLPYINDPDLLKKICDICDIAIYADDTILYSKFDQASDLWQQLELAFDFEYDL